MAELLVERSDLAGALDWATTGVEICLARGAVARQQDAGPQGSGPQGSGPQGSGSAPAERQPTSAGGLRAVGGLRSVSPVPSPEMADDGAELGMLLSLRYRIRNDLGLAEDSYDKLLDEA